VPSNSEKIVAITEKTYQQQLATNKQRKEAMPRSFPIRRILYASGKVLNTDDKDRTD